MAELRKENEIVIKINSGLRSFPPAENNDIIRNIFTLPGRTDEVYSQLLANKNSHLQVFKKEDIPASLKYTNNSRIGDIILLADEGWYMNSGSSKEKSVWGAHGYNNSLPNMHPIFMAIGPSFKRNFTVDSVRTIDVYSLVCHILNLKPNARIDGSLHSMLQLLEKDSEKVSARAYVTIVADPSKAIHNIDADDG